MRTDVWVRNPDLCIRECLEVGVTQIAWDRGYLVKKGIDPVRFMDLYYPASREYRTLVVGDSNQGALELRRGFTLERPYKVHPLWEYGEPIDELETILEHLPKDRIVVVTRLPDARTGPGRRFMRTLALLQEEYPNAVLHVHGLYSFRYLFGSGFRSVDIEPRTTAKMGKVYLPNGKEVTFEKAGETPQWLTMLGYTPGDLRVPRNRCMYNIKSALWAGEYYLVNHKFEHKKAIGNPDSGKQATNNAVQVRRIPATLGDKFLCDLCSLKSSCKYFRVGAVCSVPGAEPTDLAKYFKTRDADTIIDGLGSLLALEVERMEEARDAEKIEGKVDPEVTRIINTLFDRAVKLAKLLNPALVKPQFAVNFNQNNTTISAATPQALMAAVVKELEAAGVPRNQITPELVKGVLSTPEEKRARAIEIAASERAG